MSAALSVRGLSAGYGGIRILDGIDLEAPAGELTVVVGPNGAGRTTLLRALSGLIPREGEVEFEGRRAWRFAGPITIAGEFTSNAAGRTVRFDSTSEAVALHDAETGLLLKYDTDAHYRTFVDGTPFLHQRRTQAFTCEIIPQ